MRKLLCSLGIHTYQWSSPVEETWNRYPMFPHILDYKPVEYTKIVQTGTCKICGKCKRVEM